MFNRLATRAIIVCSVATCLVLTACVGAYGPVRTDDLFAGIHQGMTKDEVERIAGAPDEKLSFPLSGNDSWAYYYYDTWGFYSDFSVTFGPDGRAVSMISQRVGYGGRSS